MNPFILIKLKHFSIRIETQNKTGDKTCLVLWPPKMDKINVQQNHCFLENRTQTHAYTISRLSFLFIWDVKGNKMVVK